jgi:hypothetical protein
MAVLDRERNVVVLRIVYDGPASAGKTTSVRTLASRLGREAHTPETAGERTLYFDWLDYTGGLFEGYQLRCQIVSVPGQAMLAHRREYLLHTADSVVYVDTVAAGTVSNTMDRLISIQADARARGRSLGVVLQANKRDLPDALPALDIRDALAERGLRVGLVESVATDGVGIREAFVFGVRLALDRVREQIREGTLETATAEADDAKALLTHMRALDVEPIAEARAPTLSESVLGSASASSGGTLRLLDERPALGAAAAVLEEVLREEHAAHGPRARSGPIAMDHSPPLPPDGAVPSGLIWPPIDGRLHLADAVAEAPVLALSQGGWRASTDRGWRFVSPVFSVFHDVDDGRGSLVHLARVHVAHASVLSGPRCVVVARDGARWRLWQIVRERVSLRQRLAATLDETDSNKVAAAFVDAARRLIELDERLRAIPDSAMQATVDSTGVFAGATQYVGFVPDGGSPPTGSRLVMEDAFGPITSDWGVRRGEVILALKRGEFAGASADVGIRERLVRLLEA